MGQHKRVRSVAVLSGLAALLVSVNPVYARPAPIQVAHTGGDGVLIRNAPNRGGTPVGWMPEGASPDYNCYVWGERINGVPIWFNVNWNGVTGFYASAYDNSSYQSDAELQAKYGVPTCGSTNPPPPSAPQPAPAPTAPAPAADPSPAPASGTPEPARPLPPGGSLYYSPFKSSDAGWIEYKGGFLSKQTKRAYAPSPADYTLHLDEWWRDDCDSTAAIVSRTAAVPPWLVATPNGKQITRLAGWSLGRLGPIMYLGGPMRDSIDYVLLIDPGSKADYYAGKCDRKFDQGETLALWLAGSENRRLAVLAGAVTADYDHKVNGRAHAGIQNKLFNAVRRLGMPRGRNIRKQVVVCNYPEMNHGDVWIKYRSWINKAPITASSCPDKAKSWSP